MKPTLIPAAVFLLLTLFAHGEEALTPLFNGNDLTGLETEGNWVVEEGGVLSIQPREGEEGWKRYGSYLWADRTYSDFILELEYKHEAGGNSGVFFRCGNLADPVTSGIEVQIKDSHGKEDVGPHDCGGVIKTAGPTRNMAKPAGEWNHLRIEARGPHLKVSLNGEQIVDIQLNETAAKDKPLSGHLGLQDHGVPLWFRNIRIADLSAPSQS